ncbi:MAG TPA: hypothetical protein VGD67_22650 [Pseudonocardiaceae bacterium]
MAADLDDRSGGVAEDTGHVAYDIVKAMFERLSPRAPGGTGRPEADAARLLAELAVQARCAQLGLPVPARAQLRCVSWAHDGAEYTFRLDGLHLAARVLVPAGRLDGCRLAVRLAPRTP